MLTTQYHEDGPFNDPLIRCNNCGKLALTEKWKKKGFCSNCGNRRCRNVMNMNGDDYALAVSWGVDPEFFKLFEQVDDDE